MRFLKMLSSHCILRCFVDVCFLEQARFHIDFLSVMLLIFDMQNRDKISKNDSETTCVFGSIFGRSLERFWSSFGEGFGRQNQ